MQNKLKRKMTVSEAIFGHTPHRDQVALFAPGRKGLIYSELQQQLRRTIEKLHWAGIGRGDRVAIVLPNGPELATALLAVSSCAVSAPLNPGYTANELDYFVSQLNASAMMVVSDAIGAARDVAVSQGIPIIELNLNPTAPAGFFELDCKKTTSAPDTTFPAAEDTALLLHTSGTMSRSKLVTLTNANLMSSVDNIIDTLHLTERDRCLNLPPLFHIHGIVAALLSSLTSGGSVVCTPGCLEEEFFGWLKQFEPSWYTAVPTMHQAILSGASSVRNLDKTSLRFIRSSSAQLLPSVMQELEAVFKVPVIEAYGMTEASHQITSNPLPPRERKPGSVGLTAETQVAIVDAEGNTLPPDETGEVVVRGEAVTCGYENAKETNAQAFIDGWLRTGDNGRIDADGYLYLSGRIGDVINRGSVMISPIEVDEALMKHPDIKQAVAFAIAHPTLGEDLVAAVVSRDPDCLTESDVREFALSSLVGFKVPSQVIVLDELPISATGKVSRKSLAHNLRQHLQKDYVVPKTAIEALLVDFFREVLRIEKVGVHDNFFLLGGDSLTAGQVISRLGSLLQVEIPISLIFEKPTAFEIALKVKNVVETQADPNIVEVLTEIESLSDEDVSELLAAETKDGAVMKN